MSNRTFLALLPSTEISHLRAKKGIIAGTKIILAKRFPPGESLKVRLRCSVSPRERLVPVSKLVCVCMYICICVCV